jgi:hypothetical protein
MAEHAPDASAARTIRRGEANGEPRAEEQSREVEAKEGKTGGAKAK